ncbi:MAG: hypothetical protein Q8O31_04530 [Rhodocyclaceae bacterium]|nr:hypothetical protein [Rhodocyclaceae bacterium]
MDRYDQMIKHSEDASKWLATAPRISSAAIGNGRLVMELTSGVVVSVPWSQMQLGSKIPTITEILGNGLDVYFPELDDSVFVPDILSSIANLRLAA